MTTEQIHEEIKEMCGRVPTHLKQMPPMLLKLEWELWKRVQNDEGAIPRGYRELIGLAASAALRCAYGTFYHTEVAKVYGASDEEIESAAHFAKSAVAWSTYCEGMQIDIGQHKAEVMRSIEFQTRTEVEEVRGPKEGPFTREQIHQELEEMIGFVPSVFQKMSDVALGEEWEIHKQLWHGEGPIPLKYRHLIGLAVATVKHSPHSTHLHTELAKRYEASEAEIEDAVHFASSSDGWCTYVTALQNDLGLFKKEITRMCEHIRSTAAISTT